MEQRCQGTLQVWAEPFTRLRVPKLYNLRTDPYEFADVTSNTYYDWFFHRDYIALAANMVVGKFVETFKEFPILSEAQHVHDQRCDGIDERGRRRQVTDNAVSRAASDRRPPLRESCDGVSTTSV